MKILILNDSPRLNGNTRTALNKISRGIRSNITGAEVELIDVTKHKLSGCTNCDACRKNGGNRTKYYNLFNKDRNGGMRNGKGIKN